MRSAALSLLLLTPLLKGADAPTTAADFKSKYRVINQDRILFGTDDSIMNGGRKVSNQGNIYLYPPDDPDPFRTPLVPHRRRESAPGGIGKVYHANAERIIPGLNK